VAGLVKVERPAGRTTLTSPATLLVTMAAGMQTPTPSAGSTQVGRLGFTADAQA